MSTDMEEVADAALCPHHCTFTSKLYRQVHAPSSFSGPPHGMTDSCVRLSFDLITRCDSESAKRILCAHETEA